MTALPEKLIQGLIPDTRIKEVLSISPVDPKDKVYNQCERDNRMAFIKTILADIDSGISQAKAIDKALNKIKADPNGLYAQLANRVAVGKQTMPSKSTIAGWIKKFNDDGLDGLMPNRVGKQATKDEAWRTDALKLYNLPSQPKIAPIYRMLVEEYGHTVSYAQVRAFINEVPAQVGKKSPYRIGTRLHNNTQTHQYNRTTEKLLVGEIYTGDGHTIDVYFKHPATGDIWRAELVVWMDVRSRYIVGWSIETSEHAYGTINALSGAMHTHNHVPAWVHVDNGSGYKSKIMQDENVGFYHRMGVEPIFAIPGNPHGKGMVERFFRTMEEDLNIFYGSAFCGNSHSKEHLRNFVNACKRGKAEPVDIASWCQNFENWLTKYHNRPHPEVKHTTPAKLWKELSPTPTYMDLPEMQRPHTTRTVGRGQVRLDNRVYRHPDLLAYNGKEVVVEYDWHTDQVVAVRYNNKLICMATLTHKKDYLPESRRVEQRDKSLKEAEKRLQRKIDEKRARAGNLIDGQAVAESTTFLIQGTATQPEESKPAITLDLNDI